VAQEVLPILEAHAGRAQLTNRKVCWQSRPSESERANIRCELVNHRSLWREYPHPLPS
jgi:hypothetical protein